MFSSRLLIIQSRFTSSLSKNLTSNSRCLSLPTKDLSKIFDLSKQKLSQDLRYPKRNFHFSKILKHGNHNHDHHDHGIHLSESDKEQDKKETNLASQITALGLVSNVALGLSKAIAGAAGNSAALLADAAHSFSDLASDIVTLAAVRYARKPPSELYPKGFAKFESIGAFSVGGILIATAIGIAEHSIEHIMEHEAPSPLALYIAIGCIVFKEILFQATNYVGKKQQSKLLMANAWHHRADVFSSVVAVAGVFGAQMGYPILDPIAAVLVSGLIAKMGYGIAKDSFFELTDRVIERNNKEVLEILKNIMNESIEFTDIFTRKTGPFYTLELTLLVDPKMTIEHSQNIATQVKSALRGKLSRIRDIVVHIRPRNK